MLRSEIIAEYESVDIQSPQGVSGAAGSMQTEGSARGYFMESMCIFDEDAAEIRETLAIDSTHPSGRG
jgi:hypothetical protein